MKINLSQYLSLAAVVLLLACCSPAEDSPVVTPAPEVEFTGDFSDRTIDAGESLSFEVKVDAGKKSTPCWYVDGKLEGSGEAFSYCFDEPGTHVVAFEIANGSGTVRKECNVTVEDVLRITVDAEEGSVLTRFQYDRFGMVAVVWNKDVEVTHAWFVNGVKVSDKAFLEGVSLDEVKSYEVRYVGTSPLGTFERNFSISVQLLPIEVSFSHPAGDILTNKNTDLNIVATPLHGGTVVSQTWTLDKKPYSEEKDFSMRLSSEGTHTLVYEAVNPDGYTFRAEWFIAVEAPRREVTLLTDFEDCEDLPAFLLKGSGNTPGISVVENPFKTGTNTSEKCLSDYISNKKGGTSGYFSLSFQGCKDAGFILTNYTGIRFKIYLGPNLYVPRMQFGGETPIVPVDPLQYNGKWETVEYEFGKKINTYLTFRPMLTSAGANVGAYTETNTMQVYIDDIELF